MRTEAGCWMTENQQVIDTRRHMLRGGMSVRTLVQRERCWKQLRISSGASPTARYSCTQKTTDESAA